MLSRHHERAVLPSHPAESEPRVDPLVRIQQERTRRLGQLARFVADQTRVTPTPANLGLLRRYVERRDRWLVDAVDALIRDGRLTDAECERLSGECLRAGQVDRQMVHARVNETRARLREIESELARTSRLASELKAKLVRAEEIGTTDELTGLPNRRRFDQMLRQIAERRQSAWPLSLLLIDVDVLKRLNDLYGHHLGDRALCLVARQLRSYRSPIFFPARYGGDEFAVMLSGARAAAAMQAANALRSGLAARPLRARRRGDGPEAVTISIGVAERGVDEAVEWLVRRADAALLRAKRAGRNHAVLG